jgi:NAD(P)-dependent dehydrogenase (short-subunit alcohol dehydrogenase family)
VSVSSEGRLAGKVAAITGAASGIGAATARLFASEGASVVVADMDAERGRKVADELGQNAFFQHVDVSSEDQVRAMVAAATDQWGRLDVLFNNAGFGGALGPIESTSLDDYDITFDVLVKGVFLGLKHAAPVMKKQGAGSIINTASVAALRSGYSPHLYAVAKAAVVKLTETVSLELAASGVRVNCICPGFIATPLAAGHPDAGEAGLDRVRNDFASLQPIGRTGEAQDIANAALFLAGDEAGFVTGQSIVVDGGISVGPTWDRWPRWMTEERPIKMYRPKGR